MTTPLNSSPDGQQTEAVIAAGMASGDTESVMRAVATAEIVVPPAPSADADGVPDGSISLPVIEQDGTIAEVFACGTAAVVTPVGTVKHATGSFEVADGQPGAVTMKVREALLGIQQGTAPDPHGWMQRVG